MSEDGNNFNSRIEGDLTARLCRLIEEVDPMAAQPGDLDSVLKELFRYAPLVHQDLGLSYPPRDPWKLAIVAIAAIYARLTEIAASHRRKSVTDTGELAEIFELQAELDVEENNLRELLGLPPVDSQS